MKILNSSADVELGELKWPVPVKFKSSGIVGYGYEKAVIIPFELITKAKQQSSLKLEVEMRYLTCADRCLMRKRKMVREFQLGASHKELVNPEIEATLGQLPEFNSKIVLKSSVQETS